MKHIKHILLSSVILLLTAGCTKEELPEEVVDTPGITLDLRIANPLPDTKGGAETTLLRSAEGNLQAGQVLTRASLPSLENESVINNVYVLFYAKDAATTSAPALFQAATGLSAQNGYSLDLDYNSLAGKLVAGTEYDIYVLANLPESTTNALSELTTKQELLALNEQQFERPLEDPGISFSGSGTFTYDKGNRETIAIDLSRTVARLDIKLSGLNLQGKPIKVQVFNQAATVPYFTATNTAPLPVGYFTSTTTRNYATGFFHTYVYPNYEGNGYEKATVTIIISNSDGSVAYMYESAEINSGTIERNKIYEITFQLSS